MKVLITGAAGHIGAVTLKELSNQGLEVIGVDNFSNYYSPKYKIERIKSLSVFDKVKTLDVRDLSLLTNLFRTFKPNIVVHLAARPGVRASWDQISDYNSNNIVGFENILTLSHNFGVEQLIFASSSSVYGDSTPAPYSENYKLSLPKSYYALSKLANEFHALNYSKSIELKDSSMTLMGLRFFTVYGPWGRPDMATLQFISSSILGKKAKLSADLSVSRDFTYVNDVANFIVHAVKTKPVQSFDIYNVCGGKPESLGRLMEIISLNGLDLQFELSERHDSDVILTHGSTEKIYKAGFPLPKTNLQDGIKSVIEWARGINPVDLESWIAK